MQDEHVKDGHVKNEHMKDVAQDVAEDKTQDVAEHVFGVAKDGSVKVLIFSIVIFQRRNPRQTHACHPTLPLGDT